MEISQYVGFYRLDMYIKYDIAIEYTYVIL